MNLQFDGEDVSLADWLTPGGFDTIRSLMVMRAILGIVGAFAVLVGVVFIGQGVNVIHGSSMSGHGGYAGLGGVLLVIG